MDISCLLLVNSFVFLFIKTILPLKVEYFIAKRISTEKHRAGNSAGTNTGIVIVGIAISMAVIIAAVAIVTGFKNEVRNKVIGFGSHIQISNYDSNLSYETKPIDKNAEFLMELTTIEGIDHIQAFALKAGIIKTEDEIHGLVLKGIDRAFDWKFFDKSTVEGSRFYLNDTILSNEIFISAYVARKLKLEPGDSFQMWFVDETPRFRKFTISGIYQTSLAEFDESFALVDIRHIQKLNGWENNQVSGLEMSISSFNQLDRITWEARDIAASHFFEDGSRLKVSNIVEKYPQIFDWLELQDLNVVIIIFLMLIVAGFNMISGLLILILDRTQMIGVLKALGGKNLMIRKIFLYQSAYLILRGLFWGNLLGIGLCTLQKKFELISLDPENYYLTTVPVNLDIINILLINAGTITIIMLFLILPSLLVSRISPAKTIRFN